MDGFKPRYSAARASGRIRTMTEADFEKEREKTRKAHEAIKFILTLGQPALRVPLQMLEVVVLDLIGEYKPPKY